MVTPRPRYSPRNPSCWMILRKVAVVGFMMSEKYGRSRTDEAEGCQNWELWVNGINEMNENGDRPEIPR